MDIIKIFNPEEISETEKATLRHRRAVRTVVFDEESCVALLHITNGDFYELPGGGVDTNESYEEGAIRECKEEIGCTIAIQKPLGIILEYRKRNTMINESHGFVGKLIDKKGIPILVGDENDNEKSAVVIWVPLSKAIELMESIPVSGEIYQNNSSYRDLEFLKCALLSNAH
ncbi:MAG: NUDIX hydrolase [Candidatus Paceibacterota bacterium]